MGKFGENRGGGGFRRNNGGSDRNDRSDRGSSSRGGYNRGGGGNGGSNRRGEDDNAVKLGDISVSEKVADELGEAGLDDLRDSKLSMYVKVYPPKGVEEITIRRGDFINIRVCKSKHGKERTVGFVTVSSQDE